MADKRPPLESFVKKESSRPPLTSFVKTDNRSTTQKVGDFIQKVPDYVGLGTTVDTIGSIVSAPFIKKETDFVKKYTEGANKQVVSLLDKANKESDPAKKQQILAQVKQINDSVTQLSDKLNKNVQQAQKMSGIGEKELAMDPKELAMRRAAGTAAEVSSFLIPTTKATTVAGRIGRAGITGAEAGALQGAATATRDAQTVEEAATDVAAGAAVGGVAGATLQGGIEGLTSIKNSLKGVTGKAKDKLVEMYGSTLKNNVKNQKFYQQYPGGEKGVVIDSIKYDVAPTEKGVRKQLNYYGKEYNRIITEETARLSKEGKTIDIAKAFREAQKRVKNKLGYDENLLSSANKWFKDNAKKYASQSAAKPSSSNNLRISLDQKVGDVLTPDAYGPDAARKAFASELRMAFKDKASYKTREAIQKYHLLSGLAEAMQVEPKFGIVEAALAASSPGTGPANILELIAAKAVRSPGLRRTIATQGIKTAAQPKISASQIKPKVVIPALSALQRVLNERKNEKLPGNRLP